MTTEQRVYGIFRRGGEDADSSNHGAMVHVGALVVGKNIHGGAKLDDVIRAYEEALDWCTNHDPPIAETVQNLVDLGMAHNLHGNSHGAQWAFERAIPMDQTLVERLIRKSHERLGS